MLSGRQSAHPRLFRAHFASRLLPGIDGLPLDSIDDHVEAGLEGRARGMAAQDLAAGGQRHFCDLRVGRAAVLLAGELDDRIRFVVEQTLETTHLAFGVLPHGLRDVDVLALDDRPHR